ncbi:MAG: MBL fold metallo-hydrolase [Candidatus Lokiarchaeota archaeon]|nr:MBL fold metallo-hydrolase [Candidatus Lokiarchaeota archaeon]
MKNIAVKISEDFQNIYYIEGKKNGRYPYSNSFLVGDYIVDTGISPERINELKKRVKITNVLLSHWHEDHISGNQFFKNARFSCHPADKSVVEDISKMTNHFEMHNPTSEDFYGEVMRMLNCQNTKVNSTFSDNDIFYINDELHLQVIHTPGHTAGHCCFLEQNSRIVFLADIDLTKFGPWYGALDSSVVDFENSILKLINMPFDYAFTSHGSLIEGNDHIKTMLEAYLSIIYERDDTILSNLSERIPTNPKQMSGKNIIYKTYSISKIYEIFAEEIMLQYHLDKFLGENKVIQEGDGYILR